MEHSYFKDRISAYHDRELKHEEAQMMAEHLETCEECRKLLEELEKFDRMVEKHSGLADDEYWEKSAQKIEAAISPEVTKTEIIPVKSRWTGLGWKVATIAASLAVLTFIALHEGEINKTLKEPAQAETPKMMEVNLPPVDSLPRGEFAPEEESRSVFEKVEPPAAAQKTAPPVADTDVRREKVTADTGQPEDDIAGYIDPGRAEAKADGDLAVRMPAPENVKLGSIEEEVKKLGADSEFPATQLVQSVPPKLREDLDRQTAPETTASDEAWMQYELADEAPALPKGRELRVVEKSDELVLLRQKRDSLESVISGGTDKGTVAKRKKSVATVAAPADIAPSFQGVDSIDKDELREAVDSVSKELIQRNPELVLLGVHYDIARLTDDRREYEKSIEFLKSYLDKEDSPFKLQAAWYLQRLEETD